MALIFWISPLVERDPINRPNRWSPLALELAQASGPVEIKWETASGNINFAPDGKRYAIGVADVDATQQAALEADPDVITLEIAQRGRAGRNIPTPFRARLDALISRVCGDASSGDDETQDGLLTRLINRALGTFRDDRIDVLLGLKDISVPPQAKSGNTILFRDQFTVGADTDIASYGPYAYNTGAVNDMVVIAASGRAEISASFDTHISCRITSAVAPTGDQEVILQSADQASEYFSQEPKMRMAESGNLDNQYASVLDFTSANEVQIWRNDDGVGNFIASADRGLTGGSTRFRRGRALGTGATVSLLNQVDGMAPLTFDDTAATRKTSGKPGFGGFGETSPRAFADNLQVTDGAVQLMYFPAEVAGPTGVTPAFDGGWSDSTEGLRRLWNHIKGATAQTIGQTVDLGTAAETDDLDEQRISHPLDGDQIIMGTVRCQIQAREFATSDNVNRMPFKLFVVSNDGGTVRGTLLALNNYGTTTELLNTGPRNKTVADGDVMTPVSALNGDRVVLEVGFQVSAAGGTSPQGAAEYGEAEADLAIDETATTGSAWFEFSSSLAFAHVRLRSRRNVLREPVIGRATYAA